jgi:hypothetical protein
MLSPLGCPENLQLEPSGIITHREQRLFHPVASLRRDRARGSSLA